MVLVYSGARTSELREGRGLRVVQERTISCLEGCRVLLVKGLRLKAFLRALGWV